MGHWFRREDDRIAVKLRPVEIELIRALVDDVKRVVAPDAPDSAVTRRLFPDPSPDPAVAADVRDLIEDDLRALKLEHARTLLGSLPDDGRVSLDGEQAEAWLAALNDVRLTLGTTLGVTEEREEAEEDPAFVLYDWLTYLQGSLVDALSGGLGDSEVEPRAT